MTASRTTDPAATDLGASWAEWTPEAVEETGTAADADAEPVDRETGRWFGAGALALLIGGVGVLLGRPAVLLLSVVAVTYAAYATRASPPAVALSVEREVDPVDAEPGESVEVTVTVTNEGESLLADLRLVDGVPPRLTVSAGSPRLGTALRPGARARFIYAVEARRGRHAFGPVQVIARDSSGSVERETRVAAPATLTCIPKLASTADVPLWPASTRFTGRVETDVGGEGVEFHATREYRPGDPISRIDWNRHARTRELATLQFREERAATVVLLVDAREPAFRAPAPDADHAVEHAVAAAGRIFTALLDDGDRVGIAGFGPRPCWLPPGAGRDHRERARRMLATAAAFAHEVPDAQFLPTVQLATLRQRIPVDAQFVLLSPVVDDYVGLVARRLDAHGHRVTVVSPDVTAGERPGQRLARVERRLRLNGLREAGLRVVDWQPDEPLGIALDRARRGWSR